MDAITRACRTDFTASRTSGKRSVADIDLIVMHSTEVNASARDIAHSFSRPNAEGSAHLVVDDASCYRCLPNTAIPWAAPNANSNGFHIEQCAFAAWTAAEWHKHETMLHRAAYKVAYHAHMFHIPVKFVYAEGLKRGVRGVTTHAEVSKAFPNKQGNHHDPGEGWPRDHFMALVKQYIAGI